MLPFLDRSSNHFKTNTSRALKRKSASWKRKLIWATGAVLLLLVPSLSNYRILLYLHRMQKDDQDKEQRMILPMAESQGEAAKAAEKIIDANDMDDKKNSVLADEQDMMKSSSEDTAIIITSSWIPTHPSTYMIEMAINSTKNQIAGLSPSAPIFITIDHFRLGDFDKLPSDIKEQSLQSLEQYTVNLYNIFLGNPHVYIIPSVKHLHVGGSVAKAMNLIERHFPSVRYLYYMQHDFYLAKQVNHTALISAMDKYPDKINYVLFLRSDQLVKPCGEESPINLYTETNATKMIQPQASPKLIPTSYYSDNNHLVRFQWYKATIESIISLARFPENPLQNRAYDACTGRSDERMGLYAYQERGMVVHLYGKNNPGDQLSQNNQTA